MGSGPSRNSCLHKNFAGHQPDRGVDTRAQPAVLILYQRHSHRLVARAATFGPGGREGQPQRAGGDDLRCLYRPCRTTLTMSCTCKQHELESASTSNLELDLTPCTRRRPCGRFTTSSASSREQASSPACMLCTVYVCLPLYTGYICPPCEYVSLVCL